MLKSYFESLEIDDWLYKWVYCEIWYEELKMIGSCLIKDKLGLGIWKLVTYISFVETSHEEVIYIWLWILRMPWHSDIKDHFIVWVSITSIIKDSTVIQDHWTKVILGHFIQNWLEVLIDNPLNWDHPHIDESWKHFYKNSSCNTHTWLCKLCCCLIEISLGFALG